jgi:hypothetical protein
LLNSSSESKKITRKRDAKRDYPEKNERAINFSASQLVVKTLHTSGIKIEWKKESMTRAYGSSIMNTSSSG